MKIKTRYLILLVFSLLLFLASCNVATAQNINQIKAKCPTGIAGFGSILVQADGNINAVPCTGRNFQINGVNVTAGGVTGSGTANRLPKFTSATAIGNSVLNDTGTLFTVNAGTTIGNISVNNSTGLIEIATGSGAFAADYNDIIFDGATGVNTFYGKAGTNFFSDALVIGNYTNASEFRLNLIPDTANGRFRIGDCVTTLTNCIDLNQSAGSLLTNTTANISFLSSGGSFNADVGSSISLTAATTINLTPINGNANFDLTNNNTDFVVATGTGRTVFTTSSFRISEQFALASASPCTGIVTLNGTGDYSAANTCAVDATSVVIVSYYGVAAGVLPLAATATGGNLVIKGDANADVSFFIINRY